MQYMALHSDWPHYHTTLWLSIAIPFHLLWDSAKVVQQCPTQAKLASFVTILPATAAGLWYSPGTAERCTGCSRTPHKGLEHRPERLYRSLLRTLLAIACYMYRFCSERGLLHVKRVHFSGAESTD
jgi:hypothetical protein